MPSASRSRESDWNRRDASRPFFLPPDRHAGFVATALPPPLAALASLQPPPFPQPLPSHSSVPPPMPLLQFAHESYPSLAPLSVSLPCSMPSMLPSTFQSYPNAVAGIAWHATDRDTLLKPHRDSASQRHRVSKSAHFSQIPSYFSRSVAVLEISGVSSSSHGSDPRKPRRFADRVADIVASFAKFRDGLIAFFGRFEFEGAYRATLRGLRQSGSESVDAYAARTTDLC